MTGVPQAMASIMTRPKGSGQSIGKSSARGAAEEGRLVALADLADVVDQRVGPDQGLDLRLPVGEVGVVDLGGDPERHAGAPGDLDGAVGPLLGRDAAEEGEIAAGGARAETVEFARQAVVDGAHPVDRRHRRALGVGDGDQRHVGEDAVERHQVGQVEPAVQRRHRGGGDGAQQRELQEVDVEVQDVEVLLRAGGPARASGCGAAADRAPPG